MPCSSLSLQLHPLPSSLQIHLSSSSSSSTTTTTTTLALCLIFCPTNSDLTTLYSPPGHLWTEGKAVHLSAHTVQPADPAPDASNSFTNRYPSFLPPEQIIMDTRASTSQPVHSPLLLPHTNEPDRSMPIPLSDPGPSFSEPRPDSSLPQPTLAPNSAPVSFSMNNSGPWTTPWNWGGSLGGNSQITNSGQDHDRDSPMPDAHPDAATPDAEEVPPPRNLVRVTSTGTSIDSADPPDLHDPPVEPPSPTDDDMDNQMPDAPTEEQLLDETGGDPRLHAPPPHQPDGQSPQQQAAASNWDTPWYSIPEDHSLAEEDEVKRLESAGEMSALNHEYWQQKTFKDLQDPGQSMSILVDLHRIQGAAKLLCPISACSTYRPPPQSSVLGSHKSSI